jgi:peptidyl-tRNA hydrolase, PTH1 family
MTFFGLGNPGERYAETRHNVGFMVADELRRRLHLRYRHLPGRHVARAEFAGTIVRLVKPLLYMNESGVPVKEQLAAESDDFMVICDDLALPFGKLRLRPKGSDGGHNGLASIVYHLATTGFPRLRIGIGEVPEGDAGTDYVLARFSQAEQEQLPGVIGTAADACLAVVTQGLQKAMNRFNPESESPIANPQSPIAPKSEIGDSRLEMS